MAAKRPSASETSPLLVKTDAVRGQVVEVPAEARSSLWNLTVANIVVCILYISQSLYSPSLSQYVYHRISAEVFGNDSRVKNFSTLAPCFQNTSDPGYRLQQEAQVVTSQKLLQYTVLASALAVVCNIFLGTYSDYLGRKFLYVACMTGYFLRTVVTAVIIYWDLHLNFFYVAMGLYGLSGGSWAFTLVSYAYTADNTPPRQSRSLGMAVIEAVTGVSTALASLAAGYFIEDTGYFFPCLTSGVALLVGIVVVVLFMEETCPRRRTSCVRTSCVSPLLGIKDIVSVYVFNGTRMKKMLMWLALVIFFFSIINNSGASNLDTLFEMNLPFCWSPEQIGWFGTVSYLVKSLVGVLIVKGLQVVMKDEGVGVLASLSALAGDFVWGFANAGWMLYVGVPVLGIVGFAATPVIRGIMSKMAPPDKQGALFASLAVVEALSSTFGTPMFNKIYQSTVNVWSGAVYIAMGAMHLSALLFYILFIALLRKGNRLAKESMVHVQGEAG